MYLPILCIISVLLSALTCWALPVRNAWLIPISIGFFLAYLIGLVILTFVYLFISSLLLPKESPPPKKSRFAYANVKSFCKATIQVSRMRLNVSGLEKIPDEPFLYIANHRSNLDPFLTIALLAPRDISFATKEGNMKRPIVGPYIRRAGFLVIDRENPRNALKTIRTAADLINRDHIAFGIYPEGTRNTTDEPLLPFHEGVFMTAQKANVPVVVAATKNTEQVAKRFPFRSTKVSFSVLHVYSAEEVKSRRQADLSNEAYSIILKHLTEGDA